MNKCLIEENRLLILILISSILLPLLLCIGCSGPKVMYAVKKLNETGIEKNDKIVILSGTSPYLEGAEIEKALSKCLSKSFKEQKKELNLFPPEEFRKIAFANANENCIDNTTSCQLNGFMRKPNLVEIIKSQGVRYIIIITQKTIKQSGEGFGGDEMFDKKTGPFFLAGLEFKAETLHNCIIYDLAQERNESGGIGLACSGSTIVGCCTGIPFYFPVNTESVICKAFGDMVAKFIINPSLFYESSGEYLP